jgi:hypothetical protein
MSKAPDNSPQSSVKGYTAAELQTLSDLEDAAAAIANTGSESFRAMSDRNAANAKAVWEHKNKVAQRIAAIAIAASGHNLATSSKLGRLQSP